ncbi:SDR family oxidoreductase [Halalkalibacter hemicellulosilyticus]|uniref:Short-chain dehydrogenase/reductase SDR n=1 Tax=Halalkalibacter hemicellulosilyticusJCM 9152 TaxID=1236971 RepID=W4QCE6_9BACI|nr:SDR family oxidoreductase [Halalkalibacter hemicellulosilyticus]GAE29731.1 short-chain dehydrogenase/reductase SDR [Halalkalibacter hemicellulosilyticusJCM 9152]
MVNVHQTVFITGGARGLGLELSKKYLEEGFRVFAGIRQSTRMTDQLENLYPKQYKVIQVDVSDDQSVKAAAIKVKKQIEQLDIVINNAAVRFKETLFPLPEIDINTSIKAFNINTLGPLRVAKYFADLIKKGEVKVWVNISSEAGSIANCQRKSEFDYCMSKAALNMQSALLQNEWKEDQVKVLAIHPGWMKTDMGGERAPLSPRESAQSIYKTINQNKGKIEESIFIDYEGIPYPW